MYRRAYGDPAPIATAVYHTSLSSPDLRGLERAKSTEVEESDT